MRSSLTNIVELELTELEKAFKGNAIERYRASQVFDWIYRKGVYDLTQMTNLSQATVSRIQKHFTINVGKVTQSIVSEHDRSTKLLIELKDGECVEAVSIPKRTRRTVCLSTQVGCKFHCQFCASGQAGFFRNLSAGEMIAQVLHVRDLAKDPLTHVVFMGIGEPLDNYENLLKTIHFLNHPKHLGIGRRRITVSTSGVVPKIRELAKADIPIELSVSLHAATDTVRSQIMPINKRYSIHHVIGACRHYTQLTKREVTFEYILAAGLNAERPDAETLAVLLHKMPCKVNLIPLNPIPEFPYQRPDEIQIGAFNRILNQAGVRSTVRFSSGTDITAACGQLRSVELEGKKQRS